MLAVVNTSGPLSRTGASSAARIRPATRAASSGCTTPERHTMNSSPPCRASTGGSASCWPRVSESVSRTA